MFWILIVIYLLILLIEVPGLLKKQLYKELMIFMGFFIIGLYMGVAFFYHWPLLAPFEALTTYVEGR